MGVRKDKPKFSYRLTAALTCLRGHALVYNVRIVGQRGEEPGPGQLQITTHNPLAESPQLMSCDFETYNMRLQIGEDAFTIAERSMYGNED